MNIDMMNKVADLMETIEPEAFKMETWWTDSSETICGTAGCIAGWTVQLDPEVKKQQAENSWEFSYEQEARHMLGLSADNAQRLFESDSWWTEKLRHLGLLDEDELDDDDIGLFDITSKQAALVLRALVDGTIDFCYDDEKEFQW